MNLPPQMYPPPESWSDQTRATFQVIGEAMIEAAPPRWEVLRWEMTCLNGQGQDGLYSIAGDDSATIVDEPGLSGPSYQGRKAFKSLRTTLYRPGAGTWFTATATVNARGDFTIDFDYDNEPAWDLTPPSPSEYAADLARFPREPESIPPWLADKLTRAAAGIEDEQWNPS